METNEKRVFKRIILAIDALADNSKIETHCLETIQALTRNSPAEVEPVYVLSPQRGIMPFAAMYPPLQFYAKDAMQALAERLKLIPSPKLMPLKILDQAVASTVGAVTEMSRYASETKTDLIVAGTHCRKGLSRFFLGSFSETLMLHSRTPLLLVSAHTASSAKFKSVFFPTDFGKTSDRVFPRVIALSKSMGAKLTLYHRGFKPLLPVTAITSPADLIAPTEVEKDIAEKRLGSYLKMARREGLVADAIYDLSGSSESEAIIKAAQTSHADLIAMAAQSGSVASTLIGSTARQVIRGATRPVWVLHAQRPAHAIPFEITEDDIMSDLTEHGRRRKRA